MQSTNFALKHRTTVTVLVFLIVVVGMVSYLALPREAAPDIKFPFIVVMVPYPGVSPLDMEQLVTTRLEAKLEDLTDVETMTSTSSEGLSLIFLKFLPDVDIVEATQRVRDRVNRARSDLPADILEPDVKEISSSDWPILKVVFAGTAGPVRLKRLAETLKTSMEALPGVLEVDLTGGLEREIRVEVNPHQLHAYGLSLQDVTAALSMENINIPGGPIKEGGMRYTLRIPEELTDPDQIEDLVVSTKFGHAIRIREVAEVVDGHKDPGTVSRYKGQEGVALSIKKQSGANIIDVVTSVKQIIAERQAQFPAGTTVTYLNDYSKYIRDLVSELENNIITALILVVLVLFLFIGGRNSLFVAVAIPLSMLVSFIVLDSLGDTLNMVTLFGLILALGMLVDNAIVIVENIYRHFSMGKDRIQAAMDGTNEVAWPVITSTLTTLAVFFPLLAWPGIMGKFMGFLPRTLIITLTSSLFVALLITPVMASMFMTRGKPKKGQVEGAPERESGFVRGYRWLLRGALRFPVLVLVATLVLMIGSAMAYFSTKPQVQFFPETTPERLQVSIRSPEGTRLESTSSVSEQVEKILIQQANVLHVLAEVGAGGDFNPDGTAHIGRITADFLDRRDWLESPFQTIENVRGAMSVVAGAELRIDKDRRGPPSGPPVNIEIAGEDFDVLALIAEQVKERIDGIEGLTDVDDDHDAQRPELQLRFNRILSNKLILHGLQVVAGTVRTAMYGTKATVYRVGDEEFDVSVRLQDRFRSNREDVLGLTVAGKEGRLIPLSQVATLEPGLGSSSIQHIDRRRVITVSGQAEGRPGPEVLKDVQKRLHGFNPKGATLSFTGENKDMADAQGFMGKALLVGLLLIAMVLLTQFNNIGQSLIILFSVLLSLTGVWWGLIINRMPFSVMMTGLGIISLAGIVVNNAIVLIDFINKLRDQGMDLKEALVEAGAVRLRPILLTAGTTILGLLPMAQGIDLDVRNLHIETGTGSMEFWGPMAITVIYGLLFATVLTTIVVPVMYYSLDRMKFRLLGATQSRPKVRAVAILVGILLMIWLAYKLIVGMSAQGM
jgi:CzcA family heavy metal efflux pump